MNFSSDKGFLRGMESTAMSDIIFNLLIFFLLSSSFVAESGIEIELPKVVEPKAMELRQIVVTLNLEGDLYINDEPEEWDNLRESLGRAIETAEDKLVVIRADDEAAFGRAVQIMSVATDLGATGVAVATQPEG